MVLVTACPAPNPREGIDFLPLTVDYREYPTPRDASRAASSSAKGKPTEKEILTSRLIDRPIRPLFPDRLALRDADHRAGALGRHRERLRRAGDHRRLGRARALEIPFEKTIAGVRVGSGRRQYVINPTYAERKTSQLDLSSPAARTPS